NDAGTDASLAPAEGIAALPLANGGSYGIPSEYDCRACHEGAPVPVLGFSALQLSADRDPLAPHAEPRGPRDPDLAELVEQGLVRNLPEDLLKTPPRIQADTAAGRAALGYLHANCGHCHADPSASDAAVPVELQLAMDPSDPAAAEVVRRQLLETRSRYGRSDNQHAQVVVPGDAGDSVLLQRMRSRDPRVQMPPLGSVVPDVEALVLIERWVNTELSN
ncbi:MAG TPA: c-type cytochrome domain-containing protein, partial [Burkholderiales bacterium]|nr:c-type cytochrome domain-containing protein [Burkholderiales bacterium]